MRRNVPLPDAAPKLSEYTGNADVPGYRQLYAAVLDGKLPADRVRGRIMIDVAEVAKALGMQPARRQAA